METIPPCQKPKLFPPLQPAPTPSLNLRAKLFAFPHPFPPSLSASLTSTDHAKIPKYEGVRGERYVYARYFEHPDDGEFLHDLEVDPDELKNFVADPAYAETLKKMRARCDQLRDQLGGPYQKRARPKPPGRKKPVKG